MILRIEPVSAERPECPNCARMRYALEEIEKHTDDRYAQRRAKDILNIVDGEVSS